MSLGVLSRRLARALGALAILIGACAGSEGHPAHAAVGQDPLALVNGSDGALWFTEPGRGRIGRVTTAGSITTYPLPDGLSPDDLVLGADGNIWFTVPPRPYVFGRITPHGAITIFHIPPPANFTVGQSYTGAYTTIAAGADGGVWLIDSFGHHLVRSAASGVVTHEDARNPEQIVGLAPGARGAEWFGVIGPPAPPGQPPPLNAIGSIVPGGQDRLYRTPPGLALNGPIAAGAGGSLWFVATPQVGREALGHLTASGGFSRLGWTVWAGIAALLRGRGDTLWALDVLDSAGTGEILRVDPGKPPRVYALPQGTQFLPVPVEHSIALGPDGAVWFADFGHGAIGRMTVAGQVREYPLPPS